MYTYTKKFCWYYNYIVLGLIGVLKLAQAMLFLVYWNEVSICNTKVRAALKVVIIAMLTLALLINWAINDLPTLVLLMLTLVC